MKKYFVNARERTPIIRNATSNHDYNSNECPACNYILVPNGNSFLINRCADNNILYVKSRNRSPDNFIRSL